MYKNSMMNNEMIKWQVAKLLENDIIKMSSSFCGAPVSKKDRE